LAETEVVPGSREKDPILGLREGFAILVFIASIFFMMSFWLHFPGMHPILHANGIIPYASYKLEYPAVSAIVLYVSSIWRNMYAFYISMSAILFGCMVGALYVVYRALKERGEPIQRITYFMIFTPSFIYFSIYSFDWIGAVFMVAAVYFGYRRKAVWSGASIGLATAARIIPIIFLPFLFLGFKSRKNRVLLLASAGGAWLASNAYFMVTNPQGFLYPYTFQAGFYSEDSWLNVFSQYSKVVSALLLLASLSLLLYERRRFNIFQQSLLAMLAFVVFSYKFPPQYMVMLLPLFALTGEGYWEFMVADILNVMLILWYLTPLFSGGNALIPGSPVQWIAYLRQVAPFLVFARMVLVGGKQVPAPVEREALVEDGPEEVTARTN